ncbi:MAG: ribosomal protein S18-alanine N-acetyltransferase [Actinomycetota bacterium]|nr:ribosomal protein S18-alanine N-acetyltransferase [Actinomycetota bacterium]
MAARLEDPELAVVLTPMRRRHLRGVLRIEGQVYPRPWSLGLFNSELALVDQRIYIVARVGPVVAGYAGLMVVAEDGHVTTIAVDPSWQRQGLATRMLLQLVDSGVARGTEHLTLEVRHSNRRAQELYRKFGFAPAGIRRGYYVDNREDALVMWAHDVQSEEYAGRLVSIRAGVVGSTIVEGFA